MNGENVAMADQEKVVVDRVDAIVLVPASSERGVLRELAAERSWQLTSQSDPIAAMVDLTLAHHAAMTRDASEKNGSAHRRAFVLAKPERWPMRTAILNAISRYLPGVDVYCYDANGLRALGGKRSTPLQGEANQSGISGQVASAATVKPTNHNPTITREEIDMLLNGSIETAPSKGAGGQS